MNADIGLGVDISCGTGSPLIVQEKGEGYA